jgi:signal peptidase I
MRPTLNIGDLVVVLGLSNASEINVAGKLGDILVFREPSNPEQLVVQRVIDKTLVNGVYYLRTQGDNATSPTWWSEGQNAEDTWGDGLFHEKFLIGKVVGTIPYLGYIPMSVNTFLQTPVAVFLLIMLILLVILLKYPFLLKKRASKSS